MRKWRDLAASRSAEVRAELAANTAARGNVEAAVAWLGRDPLWGPEAQVLPQGGRARSMLQAVAAVWVAAAGEGRDLSGQVRTWLATDFGRDAALHLASELVRQGHPELARQVAPAEVLAAPGPLTRQGWVVSLATVNDELAAQAADRKSTRLNSSHT